jgi:protein-S-isoprenylcysteine O-methyltransferase Ste14
LKATALEFRWRFWIFLVIYVLGFVAPWDLALHLDGTGPNAHVWGQLAVLLSKSGALSIAAAFNLLLVAGILCAFAGAWLRTWGSAHLGADVMRESTMRGEGVVADGPFRYLRNPLYVGSWLMTLTLALLMPPSGAIFTIVLMVVFQLRLILGEEAFLRARLGDPYADYCRQVPRLWPVMRSGVRGSGARPRWGQAVLAEIFMWGVAVSFAVLGWRYNARLLIQCVLVSVGVSLIARAFATQPKVVA